MVTFKENSKAFQQYEINYDYNDSITTNSKFMLHI